MPSITCRSGRLLAVPAVLVALTGAGSCWSAVPAEQFQDYGPFAVRSNSTGQLSSGIYTIVTHTAGELKVNYMAPAEHCSSLKMHFIVDGMQRTVSDPVSPGQMTGYIDLGPLPPGEHTVGLQAEGITGGCDVGYVASWSGQARVRTSMDPSAPIDGITSSCRGDLTAQGWRVRVRVDGTISRVRFNDLTHEEQIEYTRLLPVQFIQPIIARASAARLIQREAASNVRDQCTLTLSAGGSARTLVLSGRGSNSPSADGSNDIQQIFDAVSALAKPAPMIN